MRKDRVFVALLTEPFLDFRYRGKQYELRAYGRNFTERFVYEGRKVELRKGYSGESMWGRIGDVVIGSLEEIFDKVDFKLIKPGVSSRGEAVSETKELLGENKKYIAFQVFLDNVNA